MDLQSGSHWTIFSARLAAPRDFKLHLLLDAPARTRQPMLGKARPGRARQGMPATRPPAAAAARGPGSRDAAAHMTCVHRARSEPSGGCPAAAANNIIITRPVCYPRCARRHCALRRAGRAHAAPLTRLTCPSDADAPRTAPQTQPPVLETRELAAHLPRTEWPETADRGRLLRQPLARLERRKGRPRRRMQ